MADIAGRATPGHGYPLTAIKTTEARLGIKLPGTLRDYYLSVGRHRLNQGHNRLLPPDRLHVSGGRLVFMEENQQVTYWGVRSRSKATDPVVFQATDPEGGEWVAESRCTQFLPAMLCWQAVSGGLPCTGYSDPINPALSSRLMMGWPSAGRMIDVAAFARSGQIVCVVIDGKSAIVHVATRSRRDFQALVSDLGVTMHET